MINETYKEMLGKKSVIRQLSEFATARGKEIGYENVFDYSLGNPSVPVPEEFTKAMIEMLEQDSPMALHGYSPSLGNPEFKQAVADSLNRRFGMNYKASHIFPTSGAAGAIAHALRAITKPGDEVIVFAPFFPEYIPYVTGTGAEIVVVPADTKAFQINFDKFEELLTNKVKAVLINSPNNPTGAVYTKVGLKEWVDYANANGSVILFDAAYEAFIEDDTLPKSIFEIEGARTCAIEICSLSKTAGFTGTRLGYTVIPKTLERYGMNFNAMWVRNRTTKTNGVSYIIQVGGAAVFTDEGQKQIHENINIYKKNAKVIMEALDAVGIWYCGGKNAPYVWMKCPDGMGSWEFFDYLLENIQVIGTPGEGFGKCGEGYFRFSSFGSPEDTKEAAERIKNLLKK